MDDTFRQSWLQGPSMDDDVPDLTIQRALCFDSQAHSRGRAGLLDSGGCVDDTFRQSWLQGPSMDDDVPDLTIQRALCFNCRAHSSSRGGFLDSGGYADDTFRQSWLQGPGMDALLHAFLGPDDFSRYVFLYVRLYWTGFGLQANMVEDYVLLAALLHVFLGPDDFNGYGFLYIRLDWTGFVLQANIAEDYVSLSALLHVFLGPDDFNKYSFLYIRPYWLRAAGQHCRGVRRAGCSAARLLGPGRLQRARLPLRHAVRVLRGWLGALCERRSPHALLSLTARDVVDFVRVAFV